MRITLNRGACRYFRWPYHAKVMKTLETVSSSIVVMTLCCHESAQVCRGGPPWPPSPYEPDPSRNREGGHGGPPLQTRAGGGRRHQVDINPVKPFRVEIKLHHGRPHVGRNLTARLPEQRVAVTRAVVHIHVHVHRPLDGDDLRLDQRDAGNLVPH